MSIRRSPRARVAALAVAVASFAGPLALTTATPATALTAGQVFVLEASHHRGQPYVWGAAGPTRFDCSGFTKYVFGRYGRRLPHNAALQYRMSHHVAKASKRVGDLIFFRSSSGSITHVGIYAGGGRFWAAPHTGARVRLAPIYTSNYVVGRIY